MNRIRTEYMSILLCWSLSSSAVYALDEFSRKCLESRKLLSDFKAVIAISYPRIEGRPAPRYDGFTREFSIALSDRQRSYKAIQKWTKGSKESLEVHLCTPNKTFRDDATTINGTLRSSKQDDLRLGMDPRLFGLTTSAPTSVGRDFPDGAFWFVKRSESSPKVDRGVKLDGTPAVCVTYQPREGAIVKVWYSVEHAFNPIRITFEMPEHASLKEITCSYQAVSTGDQTIWFPKEMNYQQRSDGQLALIERAVVESIEAVGVDELDFSFASLPLPEGRKIMSEGVGYKFSKGKAVPAHAEDELDPNSGRYTTNESDVAQSQYNTSTLAFWSLVCSLVVFSGLLFWKFRKSAFSNKE